MSPVTSLIATSVSGGVPDTRQMSVNDSSDFQSRSVTEVPDLEDVPLPVVLQRDNLRKMKARKKSFDLCKLCPEGRPDPIRRSRTDEDV